MRVNRDDYNITMKPGSNRRIIYWTAILSIFALVSHAIDAPDHLSEWWGYGTFFVIVAAFQFFYGLALFLQPWKYDQEGNLKANPDRYGRPYFVLGLVLASLIVVIYVITRTTGMPFLGSDAVVEPVTPLSLLPPLVCLPLIYCFAILIRRTRASYPAGQTPA